LIERFDRKKCIIKIPLHGQQAPVVKLELKRGEEDFREVRLDDSSVIIQQSSLLVAIADLKENEEYELRVTVRVTDGERRTHLGIFEAIGEFTLCCQVHISLLLTNIFTG